MRILQDTRQCRRFVFATVFCWSMAFALFTNHTWEDYYITYRSSKNLATGNGLVYTPGEKLHTFTSPLGVLVPAALAFVTGNSSDTLVLWLFRSVCASALAGAAVLLLTVARRVGLNGWSQFFLIALIGIDPKIVGFTVNGMETAFLFLFFALMMEAFTGSRDRCVLKLGLAWAGLMWTRPDSFIYIGAMSAGFWLFGVRTPSATNRREVFVLFLKAGLITTAVYLPWILWANWYYGTYIPNTVIAKSLTKQPASLPELIEAIVLFPLRALSEQTSLINTYQPAYFWFEGWHYSVEAFARALAIPCALYWLLPFGRPMARAASLTFAAGHIYLTEIARLSFPWYLPIIEFVGFWVLAEMLQQGFNLANSIGSNPARQHQLVRLLRGTAVGILTMQLAIALCVWWQLRHQQRLVEDGNRKQIGLWLAGNAGSPADSVFLEPVGYIGYFSKLKMYDFPGLTSREMLSARYRRQTDEWRLLIRELRPNWLVLRDYEAETLKTNDPPLLTHFYAEAKRFDVTAEIESISWLPGRGYLSIDGSFVVYKKMVP